MLQKVGTVKCFLYIIVYFILFFAGALSADFLMESVFKLVNLSDGLIAAILTTSAEFAITFFLLWIFTRKVFHLTFNDFGINCNLKWWAIAVAVLLPSYMIAFYALAGKFHAVPHSGRETVLLAVYTVLLALRSGILEEMLFRGFIMKSLESRWNKIVAVMVPSVLFALVHIPGMKFNSAEAVLLLIAAGTMVGIMFSVLALKGSSIANSAIVHCIWNGLLIMNILKIVPASKAGTDSIFLIELSSDNIFLTGSDFGIEASLVALAGYTVTTVLLLVFKSSRSCLK